jgi:hypothetical protein
VRAQLVAHDGSLPDDVVTCENERVLKVGDTPRRRLRRLSTSAGGFSDASLPA